MAAPLVPKSTMRRIRTWLAAGVPPSVIAATLNATGVVTAKGRGVWHESTINHLRRKYFMTYTPQRRSGYVHPDSLITVPASLVTYALRKIREERQNSSR